MSPSRYTHRARHTENKTGRVGAQRPDREEDVTDTTPSAPAVPGEREARVVGSFNVAARLRLRSGSAPACPLPPRPGHTSERDRHEERQGAGL